MGLKGRRSKQHDDHKAIKLPQWPGEDQDRDRRAPAGLYMRRQALDRRLDIERHNDDVPYTGGDARESSRSRRLTMPASNTPSDGATWWPGAQPLRKAVYYA